MIEFNKVGYKAAEKKVLNLKEYFDPMAGVSVFYVRPFTEELTQELEEQMRMMEKAGENRKVVITEQDGVYKFASTYEVTIQNFVGCNLWGMYFRRFSAAARDTLVEQMTQKRYYKAVMSNEFIASNSRVYAA